MMKARIALFGIVLATLAACSSTPLPQSSVQQLDSRSLWSTGSYR